MHAFIRSHVPVRPGDTVRVCVNSLWRGAAMPELPSKFFDDDDIVYGTLNQRALVLAVIAVDDDRGHTDIKQKCFILLMVSGILFPFCWSWPEWLEMEHEGDRPG